MLLDDVFGAKRLPDEFKPVRHIYYDDRLYDVRDGLPKYADMPAEHGGSGKQLDDTGNPLSPTQKNDEAVG